MPTVYWSEGTFIRNGGSICYDKNEMIRAFGRATFVHIQAELGQEMVYEMNQMTLFSRHRIRTMSFLRSSTLPLDHEGPPNI